MSARDTLASTALVDMNRAASILGLTGPNRIQRTRRLLERFVKQNPNAASMLVAVGGGERRVRRMVQEPLLRHYLGGGTVAAVHAVVPEPAYKMVDDMADALGRKGQTSLRRLFAEHLRHVAVAMRAVEWVESGDYGEGEDDDPIRVVLGAAGASQIVTKRATSPVKAPATAETGDVDADHAALLAFESEKANGDVVAAARMLLVNRAAIRRARARRDAEAH